VIRECGGCYLCCRTYAIPELHILEGQRCPEIVETSGGGHCGSYDTRAPVCQRFRCLWLEGWRELRDIHRPDLIRTIFTWAVAPATVAAVGLPGVLRANVSAAGPQGAGRLVIERLAERLCVIEIRAGSAELHGPSALRRAMLDVIGAVGPKGAGFADVREVTFNGGRVRWKVAS
jgi:hypothetical protein